MVLANDNMWGYPSDIIVRYKVRWIEMAIVLPVWTTMMVYYVEGDYGHLMEEQHGKVQDRTAFKGHCFSFVMPWEDIIRNLTAVLSKDALTEVPRPPEVLRFLFTSYRYDRHCLQEEVEQK